MTKEQAQETTKTKAEPKSNEVQKTKDPKLQPLLEKAAQRRAKAPKVSITQNGLAATMTIGKASAPDDILKLMTALGTLDPDFMNAFLGQIGNSVSRKDKLDQDTLNFALGVIFAVEPKDEIEALLAAQMAAVHICAMDSSRRFLWAEGLASRDSAERALTKLTRTFALQMETLKRYRSKGQQVVRVERVTVHDGGQAIVGAVRHGGEG